MTLPFPHELHLPALWAALHWGQPLAFLLLPLPFLLAWLLWRRPSSQTTAAPRLVLLHPNVRALLHGATTSQWPSLRRLLPALALLCLILALAQPQRLGAWVMPPPQGRDIVVLLDTSLTMSIHDLRWNGQPAERLAVVKQVFARFIQARAGDRCGILAFGTHAATLLPPTFDRQLAAAMVARARIGMLGDDTALGDAIGLALRQVRAEGKLKPVLILYSDNGASNVGQISPAQAVALARALGVRIFTVQVGDTPASGQPYTVPAYQGPQPDMRAIAEQTGGRYFYAASHGAQEAAIHAIGQLTPTLQPPPQRRQAQQLYAWPLALGMVLWLLAQWPGVGLPRKRPRAAGPQPVGEIES
uniref:Putative Von Willebrand factor, type A n=1 Tax=mine drainage metagenome TaxID=410659 RepID=E6PM66_9ZZZZ